MPARVQRGLEKLYRIETGVAVDDFLIGAADRARVGVARQPREQLLVRQDEHGVAMSLFLDEAALSNLVANDPAIKLHDGNLQDFLLVVEGVSHFVYVAWRAQADQSVSALELELQAEVDKYVTCLLGGDASPALSPQLRHRLFERIEYEPNLDDDEIARYRVANDSAHDYAASLENRFVRRGRVSDMLDELRRFYRLSLNDKLEFIRAA